MIWLIGNKGSLGREVEALLRENELKCFVTDIDCDITDFNSLRDYAEGRGIKWVINCSGYTAVDKAEDEPDPAYAINAEGVLNIAKIATEIGAILIHISTDYVFDGKKKTPYVENDKTNPICVYGKSKVAGEYYIQYHCKSYFIIRTAWLYGKHGNNFVYTMLNLFKEKNRVMVIDDQWGTPTYSKDLAGIVVKIIQYDCTDYGIYHFTNDGSTNWYLFAKAIYNEARNSGIINSPCSIRLIHTDEFPAKAKRPKYSILCKEKIKTHLNIAIRDWKEALHDFIKNDVVFYAKT